MHHAIGLSVERERASAPFSREVGWSPVRSCDLDHVRGLVVVARPCCRVAHQGCAVAVAAVFLCECSSSRRDCYPPLVRLKEGAPHPPVCCRVTMPPPRDRPRRPPSPQRRFLRFRAWGCISQLSRSTSSVCGRRVSLDVVLRRRTARFCAASLAQAPSDRGAQKRMITCRGRCRGSSTTTLL